jgi:fatty-acyl-CoA synthase
MQRFQCRSIADIEEIERTPLADRLLAPSTFDVLCESAARHPDCVAIEFLPSLDSAITESITYRQLLAKIIQTANLLSALGVTTSDAVSVLLPNLPHSHVVIWAAQATGIVHPINPLLSAPQISEMMRAAGTKVLVVAGPGISESIWAKALAATATTDSVKTVVVVGSAGLPAKHRDAIRNHARSLRRARPGAHRCLSAHWRYDRQAKTCSMDPREPGVYRLVDCAFEGH